jgi:hypothetical protein
MEASRGLAERALAHGFFALELALHLGLALELGHDLLG